MSKQTACRSLRIGQAAVGLLLVLAALGGACRKPPQARSYNESAPAETAAPAVPPHPMPAPEAPISAAWVTPSGWQEEKGNGIRLVSFTVPATKGESGLCTLIPLQGEAGGRRANVQRWMQQLGLTVPADAELDKFLASQPELRTAGNWPTLLVDLTPLAEKAGLPTAMTVAIVTVGEHTLFVKFTGSPALLQAQNAAFIALCRSLKPGGTV